MRSRYKRRGGDGIVHYLDTNKPRTRKGWRVGVCGASLDKTRPAASRAAVTCIGCLSAS